MIKLSKPSKMPCPSWSLQALETCPGSRKKNGQLVDACEGCYATDGNYRFPNVKAPRIHNKEDWKRAGFVSDMVAELDNHRYFRWFDSGDVYHPALALKILEIMRLTPWCKHWLPTRMHKFPKFRKIFNRMNRLENAVVRYSSDSISGETIRGKNSSTIVQYSEDANKGAVLCEAYARDGKCGSCRACWDKDIPLIAYPAHGRKMAKQYKLIQLKNVA
tara:strand:- start:2 stop:655 length:654 start_codon:yes stop_codon:yes gene_type:complete